MNSTATRDWSRIEGKWNEVKGRVKSQWGKLTDDEITRTEGNRDKLLGLIQQKYSVGRDKAEEQLNDWTEQAESWMGQARDQVAQTVEKGKEYVQQGIEKGTDYVSNTSAGDMAKDFRELIARYPVQAALIGIGVGYLLSRVLNSGNRS